MEKDLKTPNQAAPENPETATTPETQPSAREQALLDRIKQLEADASKSSAELSAAAKRVKDAYKVPDGEKGFHHVLITQQGGKDLDEPVVKAFDPHQYETSISKLPGFKGEIIHKATKK